MRRLVLVLLLFLLGAPAHAQAQANEPTKLVIGTMRVPPFVLRGDDGEWSGLSIDLWKKIAAQLGQDFEFRDYDYDPQGLLSAVERGEIDVAVAAIPVTVESESRFDFSHPYFAADLGIAVHAEPQRGLFGTVTNLFTPQFFRAVAGLLTLLILVGALMWLLERRHNAGNFDPHPARGIGDGLWWAAVTMTTTGYGDKVPISWRGRALGLVWMFSSIFFIALFSATLASSFVVNRLKTGVTDPGDLPQARVGAVSGTVGEFWLATQGLDGRKYPFVIQATKALQRGDVDALIYDRAILGYMMKHHGWRDLHVLPHKVAVHNYAIALPPDSPLKEAVNRALLTVTHQPDWREVVQRYVGSADELASADAP